MRRQLVEHLARLEAVELSAQTVSTLRDQPGVYELFLDGELVYVGKAGQNLQERLSVHLRKLGGRTFGLRERCTFKAIYILEDLNAFGPEYLLIEDAKQEGRAPWNFNGFGNKDPGRQRDTTVVKEG